ncbi:hypothetical protein SJI00_21040 [Pseudomonas sp. RP23018S]|uniref:hypothetical protein n=1 Tax=Pseudomonas sp. RP23018S TaxID=3096037 RepID=UPI002ACAF236|nr:hypothetical protein [Pseudomonas sp. RP23018S]MDZ5605263.1 hypothetical protein [Pseudomonas sp. RP23018S]
MAEYFRLSDRTTGHRIKLYNSITLILEGEALPQLINITGHDWTDEQLTRIAEAAVGVRQEWHLRSIARGMVGKDLALARCGGKSKSSIRPL